MTQIIYRHPTEAELLPACRVIRTSYKDLQAKSGRKAPEMPPLAEPPKIIMHMRRSDPEGCWIASIGSRVVGFGQALVRGKQWYLANLFVDTRTQQKGVGRELLRRCVEYGKKKKVDSFALCTFPYNEVALGLYSSFGFMPRYPIFEMRNLKALVSGKLLKTSLRCQDGKNQKSISRINRLEKKIRGYSRIVDIRYFMKDDACEILDFYSGRQWVGYSFIHNSALIAPAGAISPRYLPDILTESFKRSLMGESKMTIIFAGGSNRDVYEHLTGLGFKIDNISVFLSTKSYGDFSRYIPAHLALF